MAPNKSLILGHHPSALPIPGTDLLIQTTDIDLTAPPPPGAVLVKTNYLSYDPYQRGRMRPSGSAYISGYALGTPLTNQAICTVLASSNPRFKDRDIIIGTAAFSEYQIIAAERAGKSEEEGGFDVLENPLGLDEKVFLGALGMSGLTAYSSFYEVGKPKKGEVIFISAASGAVGQIVGQLAKREGLKVIGSVGSEEKLRFITGELGFDGGFVYKTEKAEVALPRLLKELGEEGLSIYYDNVGGEQLDAALLFLKTRGRIVSCGSVSQTSLPASEQYGIKNMGLVVGKRLTIRGFIVYDEDMGQKYREEHRRNMSKWIKDGEIKVKMSVTDGMENAAEGLVGMLKGENFGKAVLRVAEL